MSENGSLTLFPRGTSRGERSFFSSVLGPLQAQIARCPLSFQRRGKCNGRCWWFGFGITSEIYMSLEIAWAPSALPEWMDRLSRGQTPSSEPYLCLTLCSRGQEEFMQQRAQPSAICALPAFPYCVSKQTHSKIACKVPPPVIYSVQMHRRGLLPRGTRHLLYPTRQ